MQGRLPETTPADTPAPKPATPGPEGTPRKFAGKYDSPEALEKAYEESQRKITEMGDESARMRALLVEPAAPYTPPARDTGYPAGAPDPSLGEFVTREEAQRLADERFDTRMRTRDEQTRQQQWYSTQQQRLREDFFARYPDLQKQQRLVKAIAEEFQGKYGHLDAPRFLTLWPSIAKELADAAYADIASMKSEFKTEFERGSAERAAGAPPGGTGPVNPPAKTSPAPTPDELRAEAVREDSDRYFASRRPPSRA
jgi:hypothetical protein